MNATSPKTSILALATAMALAPAAALIFLAPGASAQTRAPITITVDVGGALQGDATGAAMVLKRVEAAAETVCAAVATRSPLLPREQADCVRDTVADAMRRIEGEAITIADASR